MPRLENWSVCTLPSSMYTAPELWNTVLYGEIYDDKRFEDGKFINTSSIKEINTITKKAQTKNTLYDLGEPDPKFIEYLKSKDFTLDDYFHIDIEDIGIEEIHRFEMDYGDFEKLVDKVYGHEDYEYVEDVECGNYSCQTYDYIGSDIEYTEISKYDEDYLKKFIETGKGQFMANILLKDMCRKKIIKPGKYLISVYW